jgi:hypothetical protein
LAAAAGLLALFFPSRIAAFYSEGGQAGPPPGHPAASGHRPSRRCNRRRAATEVEASVEASALEGWLYRHTLFGSRLFDAACQRVSERYGLREPDDYEPPRYCAYLRREARLLGDAGIRYAHSFCPTVAEKSPRSPAEERETLRLAWLRGEVAERRRLSAQIVREEGQISYDVMEALTGTEQRLFVDFCHLNDEGSDRAARDLASRVLQWLTQPRPSR